MKSAWVFSFNLLFLIRCILKIRHSSFSNNDNMELSKHHIFLSIIFILKYKSLSGYMIVLIVGKNKHDMHVVLLLISHLQSALICQFFILLYIRLIEVFQLPLKGFKCGSLLRIIPPAGHHGVVQLIWTKVWLRHAIATFHLLYNLIQKIMGSNTDLLTPWHLTVSVNKIIKAI